ncbi:UDP-glucose/GDP-mannose dehydrogenase family, NAD binding domain-containing protein [Apiosordaria backusii]|uniref:UDP-glucose 6-dehydrogenase n=1 Tax=Apiosordaria backusii TaxID=314023 RepID=A0AA40BMX6_9PEZI|nr:UDP-glucose/GDP-mannose dehydrogenase family, NAD binding domain-containing protein [Apiosordaria backusii]
MPSRLARSFPSSHSIASTFSPGSSTPGSWTANPWLRDTPDTSPPSSDAGSPKLQANQADDGGPTAAVIAYHNPHIQVNVVDLNENRIKSWNSAHLPIHEDGLLKVVRTARDGTVDKTVALPGLPRTIELKKRQPNLVFSTSVVEAIGEADIIFICVNTPTKTHGIGAGAMADVSAIESATRTVAKHAKLGAIIVEKSTVPCGTAQMIHDILRYYRPDVEFEVLSNPEFLAEGTAVENLMHPDRILIGSAQTLAGLRAAAVVKEVYGAWVPAARIVTVNTFSSELAKLVANTMLAQRISSVNAVSAMCEELGLGADVEDVSLAIGKDARLGSKFLQAGVGFGGSCFEKDILNLAYLARELHLDVVADYWLAVLRMNEDQRRRFARNVVRELNGSLRGKKIAILGFAFKDGTNDTRNSIAVHVIKDLAMEMPREIAIFDPGCASAEIREEVEKAGLTPSQLERVKILTNWRDCVQEASAVCILTQWKQFRGRKLGSVASGNKKGRKLAVDWVTSCVADKVDISEMDILALEELARDKSSAAGDDPLERLAPLAPCPEECQHCRVGSEETHDQEPVDWAEVASMMQERRWVFDGRNVVNRLELQGLGFRVRGIGKGF